MEKLNKEIINFLETKKVNYKGINKLAEIISKFTKNDYKIVLEALTNLERNGEIFEYSKNRFATISSLNIVKGKVSYAGHNFCFVLNPEGDIFVQKRNLLNSFDGDIVLVKILSEEFAGKKREGKVVKILSRSTDNIVGTFKQIKGYGYVASDKKNFDKEIFIDAKNINGAKDNDKVVVRLTNVKSGNPVGEIVEVIGAVGAVGTDIKSILRQYKVIEKFPDDALKQAKSFKQTIDKNNYINTRKDLTDLMLFTIDGKDAKDLDDAISLTKHEDGTYSLGVHIADVGEYVRKDSKLDESAYERGTSIYFLNQVIPMLPKELSNGICSLNPNVDRLALSVLMKIDKKGNVLESEICESVINSKYRLNYDEVLEVLEGNKETQKRLSEIKDTLLNMLELSEILENRRKSLGSLNFELPESKVIVDENNKPINIEKRVATKSTKLIETFMVIANEVVAQKFDNLKIPFIYRVHEKPDSEKMQTFFNFLSSLGINVNLEKKDILPRDLQAILTQVEDMPASNVVNMVMLRSLKKAKYFDKCLGHFGLALTYYCHFTSPIRRYPDLCIHRIIKEYLHHNNSYIKSPKMVDFVVKASMQSSNTEKTAEEVERAVTDYKKCEYMSQFIGDSFNGIISGVTAKGIYVELENTCEGFISVASMTDDFYNYDEKSLALVGANGKFYRIGERVEITVADCNLSERKINFSLVKKIYVK